MPVRILLAIIALEDLEAQQIDVNNAFTEAKLKETIIWNLHQGLVYGYSFVKACTN